MKFPIATPILASALAFGAVASTGCAKNSNTLVSERTDASTPSDATPVATSAREPASDTWARIRDDNYEQKADFVAGFHQLASDADAAIQRLNAKRATMTDTAAKDWDVAMKDLKDARADLDDKLGQVQAANSDTWSDAKDKATAAWTRVTDDLDKVRHSTTD